MNTNFKEYWQGWETKRLIGRGNFGEVYEIERSMFGLTERSAVKVISIPQNSSEISEMRLDGFSDENIAQMLTDQLHRIVKEYSFMKQLSGSVNVVNCEDIQVLKSTDGISYTILIKMELLTCLTHLDAADLDEYTAIKIGIDLCNALEFCEKKNIIHRDIKPSNIFFTPEGLYKIGDFGVSRTMEQTTGATKTGTPDYMAPEVYQGMNYNHTVDIYSLGIVLYWLTNQKRVPFMPLPPSIPMISDKEAARFRRFPVKYSLRQ